MENLKVVQQLRDLCADSQNRASIVRDQGCLPGLVIFLGDENPQVVLTALEALNYLAQVPSNRPLIKNESGLLATLKRIVSRCQGKTELVISAQTLHDILVPPAGSARTLQARSTRANTFLGASSRRSKTVTLKIEGMKDMDSRKLVEEKLLDVKGMISFTFDISIQRCYVRVRPEVKPEDLCQAVSSTDSLIAQQVVKNENGEEVMLSFGATPKASLQDEKENKPVKLPDYLPDDDSTEQQATGGDERAIEKSGAVGQGGGWFSAVSSFISNSLYCCFYWSQLTYLDTSDLLRYINLKV